MICHSIKLSKQKCKLKDILQYNSFMMWQAEKDKRPWKVFMVAPCLTIISTSSLDFDTATCVTIWKSGKMSVIFEWHIRERPKRSEQHRDPPRREAVHDHIQKPKLTTEISNCNHGANANLKLVNLCELVNRSCCWVTVTGALINQKILLQINRIISELWRKLWTGHNKNM